METPSAASSELEQSSSPARLVTSPPQSPTAVTWSPEVVSPINDQNQDQNSDWSTELCDCFSDVKSCCLVLWCPCIAFGRIAEIVDKGTSTCCRCGSFYLLLCSLGGLASLTMVYAAPAITMALGCHWILACNYRGKLKQSFNMRPNRYQDCCTHFWCQPCALCQEYRELQNRRYDLSIGWEGNMKKQVPPMVSPPVASTMNR